MISAAQIIEGSHGLDPKEFRALSEKIRDWRDRLHGFFDELMGQEEDSNASQIARDLAAEIKVAIHDSGLDFLLYCMDDEIREAEETQSGHDEHRTDFYAASGVPTGAPL